ncbi:hypothetical protein [Sicyoidochytrium minutum DNA virus]|nr:hypothetical protein [Sicyoidochytrium minutum DNA virus]BDC16931.1 hypothetical protein [Sicyoidochytrium minutum DNA virus]
MDKKRALKEENFVGEPNL